MCVGGGQGCLEKRVRGGRWVCGEEDGNVYWDESSG